MGAKARLSESIVRQLQSRFERQLVREAFSDLLGPIEDVVASWPDAYRREAYETAAVIVARGFPVVPRYLRRPRTLLRDGAAICRTKVFTPEEQKLFHELVLWLRVSDHQFRQHRDRIPDGVVWKRQRYAIDGVFRFFAAAFDRLFVAESQPRLPVTPIPEGSSHPVDVGSKNTSRQIHGIGKGLRPDSPSYTRGLRDEVTAQLVIPALHCVQKLQLEEAERHYRYHLAVDTVVATGPLVRHTIELKNAFGTAELAEALGILIRGFDRVLTPFYDKSTGLAEVWLLRWVIDDAQRLLIQDRCFRKPESQQTRFTPPMAKLEIPRPDVAREELTCLPKNNPAPHR